MRSELYFAAFFLATHTSGQVKEMGDSCENQEDCPSNMVCWPDAYYNKKCLIPCYTTGDPFQCNNYGLACNHVWGYCEPRCDLYGCQYKTDCCGYTSGWIFDYCFIGFCKPPPYQSLFLQWVKGPHMTTILNSFRRLCQFERVWDVLVLDDLVTFDWIVSHSNYIH